MVRFAPVTSAVVLTLALAPAAHALVEDGKVTEVAKDSVTIETDKKVKHTYKFDDDLLKGVIDPHEMIYKGKIKDLKVGQLITVRYVTKCGVKTCTGFRVMKVPPKPKE